MTIVNSIILIRVSIYYKALRPIFYILFTSVSISTSISGYTIVGAISSHTVRGVEGDIRNKLELMLSSSNRV